MKSGQMFIISVVFLAGLVFLVQQILLQYNSIDQPGLSNMGDDYILKNINSTLGKVFSESVNCISPACIHFSGSGRVVVEDRPSLDLDRQVSIEGWFRLSGDSRTALRKQGSYSLGFENDAPYFSFWSGGVEQRLQGTRLERGIFHHVMAAYNGSEAKIYVNGAIEARKAASGAIDISASNLTMGSYPNGSAGLLFIGTADDIAIYNASISGEQAISRFQRKAINLSPSAYWKFEESGAVVKDSAGQASGRMEGFVSGEGRISGIDCDDALRKLKEADDFIRKAAFGRYSVGIIYGETAEPRLECDNLGLPGLSLLSAKVRIVSGVSETEALLEFG